MSTTTPVKLVNESALGIYAMSWTSGPARKRNVISWYEGLDAPVLQFWVSGRNAMSPPVEIRNPARFGWGRLGRGGRITLGTFKEFCQKFADTAESEATS